MSNESFLFDKNVSVLSAMPEESKEVSRETYYPDVTARIKMIQNGFEVCYDDKEYQADTLDKAIDMVKEWLSKKMETAKKNDK